MFSKLNVSKYYDEFSFLAKTLKFVESKEIYKDVYERAGSLRVLIVHQGFSMNRHYNKYEYVSAILRELYDCKIDAMLCASTVKACDFNNPNIKCLEGINDNIKYYNGVKNKFDCFRCQLKSKIRLRAFCDDFLYLSNYISDNDLNEINNYVESLELSYDHNSYINLKFHGIDVGKRAYETLQRIFFIGKPDKINLNKNSFGYEILYNTLIQVMVAEKVIKQYDLIVVDELSYASWAIWADVALKANKLVLREAYTGNFGKESVKKQTITIYSDFETARLRDCGYPSERILAALDDKQQVSTLAQVGLDKLLNQHHSDNDDINWRNKLAIPKNKPVVCVFTHLCWDASLSFYNPLFKSFEDWIEFTYEYALKNKNVMWVFRIHPAEALNEHGAHYNKSQDKYNTLSFIKRLMDNNKSDNIRIHNPNEFDLDLYSMSKSLTAGITVGGTVSFELPSFGVPCVSVAEGGHSGHGFTIVATSLDKYKEILSKIQEYSLNESQIQKAQAYAAIRFDSNYLIDLNPICSGDTCENIYISPRRVIASAKSLISSNHVLIEEIIDHLSCHGFERIQVN